MRSTLPHLMLVIVLALAACGGDDASPTTTTQPSTTTTSAQETTTTTAAATTTTTSATTTTGQSTTTTTSAQETTTTTAAATTTTSATTTTTLPPDPNDTTDPSFVSASISDFIIFGGEYASEDCPVSSGLRFGIRDDNGVNSVVGTYEQGLPDSPLLFVFTGFEWEAAFGPFVGLGNSFEEDVTITITATDPSGNTASVLAIVKVNGGSCTG